MSHALCIVAGASFMMFALGNKVGNEQALTAFAFVLAGVALFGAAALYVSEKSGEK